MIGPGTNSLLDFGQAYRKAADYCALQDRCKREMEYKLKSWNIDRNFFAKIINKLTDEDFLNEERFAKNYAGGKFRIKGWGKIKIASALRERSISPELIQQALSELKADEYIELLKTILQKKLKELGGDTPANRQKAAFFATSRGFEGGLIASQLKDIEIPEF
jgi:regulatory protein